MNENEKEIRVLVLFKLAPVLFVLLIIVIGIFKECFGETEDISRLGACREMVRDVYVFDKNFNGFLVGYSTVIPVTKEELREIRHNDTIQNAFERLKIDAPNYFGDMLYTDIFDFAQFAKKYDVSKDVTMEYIFVEGIKKKNLYAAPNPAIPNCADRIDLNTNQGVQWIKHNDIYYYDGQGDRTYRYWKCNSIYSTSTVDERFSHFSREK